MAKPKGSPKVGGRQKGTPNKRTIDAQGIAERLGCDPLEVLLRFSMNDWEGLGYPSQTYEKCSQGQRYDVPYIEPDVRMNAAKEAAQYLYPKRKAIEHSGPNGQPISFAALVTKASEENE